MSILYELRRQDPDAVTSLPPAQHQPRFDGAFQFSYEYASPGSDSTFLAFLWLVVVYLLAAFF